MKRLLGIILSIVMIAALMPMPAVLASALSPGIAKAFASDVTEIAFTEYNMCVKMREALGNRASMAAEPKSGQPETWKISVANSELATITELNLRGGNISNLAGIENFTALRKLDLSVNLLTDANGLSSLTALEELNLYDNKISDVGALRFLTNLTKLNMGYNNDSNKRGGIANMSALENLVNLRELNWSQNWTPDVLDHIKGLTALTSLNLERNSDTSIAGLARLDVSKLAGLTNLTYLSLFRNFLVDNDASTVYTLPNLQDVVLARCSIPNINGMMGTGSALVWPNLKKLDISGNTSATLEKNSPNVLNVLRDMQKRRAIELNFENLVDTSALPHTDASGGKYVTYDDFDPRCDGAFDDFIAIRNAHYFANNYQSANGIACEVRANPARTYHIYKLYETSVSVRTDVDWMGANFVIHDEKIDEWSGRFSQIFSFEYYNSKDCPTYSNPTFTVNRQTKSIPGLIEYLEPLNAKGYDSYLCVVYNADKDIYIRRGYNQKASQQDFFKVDAQGNVLNDIQWDFDHLTSVYLIPINKNPHHVRNGNFVTNALDSELESRSRSGKSQEFGRNLAFSRASNVEISRITHTSSKKDVLSGSYGGFLSVGHGIDVTVRDSQFFTRKYKENSTYDLAFSTCVNLYCSNLTSNDIYDDNRWGIIGGNFLKDVTFERCTLNRIDSHKGFYNLTVKDCEIGCKGITGVGQGKLDVIGTRITSGAMIWLRSDFGCTWDGDVRIIDCTYRKADNGIPRLICFYFYFTDDTRTRQFDFGYPLKFPRVYIDNLTVDYSEKPKDENCFVVCNSLNYLKDPPYPGYEDYWASNIYVNRFNFIGSTSAKPSLRLTYTDLYCNEGVEYNYAMTDCALTVDDAAQTDVTKDCFRWWTGTSGAEGLGGGVGRSARLGEGSAADVFATDKGVKLAVTENGTTTNSVTVYKDGAVLNGMDAASVPVGGSIERTFSVPGDYRVLVTSHDRIVDTMLAGRNSGQVEYRFKIASTQGPQGTQGSQGSTNESGDEADVGAGSGNVGGVGGGSGNVGSGNIGGSGNVGGGNGNVGSGNGNVGNTGGGNVGGGNGNVGGGSVGGGNGNVGNANGSIPEAAAGEPGAGAGSSNIVSGNVASGKHPSIDEDVPILPNPESPQGPEEISDIDAKTTEVGNVPLPQTGDSIFWLVIVSISAMVSTISLIVAIRQLRKKDA